MSVSIVDGWDNKEIVLDRLKAKLPQLTVEGVAEVKFIPMVGHSGLTGDMCFLDVVLTGGETKRFVVKRTKGGGETTSKTYGLVREAHFYNFFAESLQQAFDENCEESVKGCQLAPKVYFAAADEEASQKVIVMECLSGISANDFCLHSVHNHGKEADLKAKVASVFGNVTEASIVLKAARMAGHIHGRYFLDQSLLTSTAEQFNVLRARNWYRGLEKESWLQSTESIKTQWTTARNKEGVKMDPRFVALVDASLAKADFDTYVTQRVAADGCWSLVHGDFHPGNMMVLPHPSGNKDDFTLTLHDWEVVGVGSGPQDIGQFMISHASPELRRSVEQQALAAYLEALTIAIKLRGDAAPPVPSPELVLKEYVHGGLARWIWLGVFCIHICPPHMGQYFHDQVLAFALDHGVTPETIEMLRP